MAEPELIIYHPNGQPFSSFSEEKERAERLAEKLKELGIDPEDI